MKTKGFYLNYYLLIQLYFLHFFFYVFSKRKYIEKKNKKNYSLSIVSNSNLISFQTSQAAANSGDHLQAERITSPPSRARSRPSLRA